MLKRLNRLWRVGATGFAFATFGLGGLVLRLTWLPVMALCVQSPRKRQQLGRLTVHWAFRSFIGLMHQLGLISYCINGVEKLDRRGLLILANHPTLVDVVFLISLVPNANCVVKASLGENLFTRGPIRAAGYVFNASSVGLIDDCIASIHRGDNLIIFPEGTRTPPAGMMKLQRGAANVAVRGPFNVTPVHIRCEPLGLTKGCPWWRVPPARMHFTIDVADDIAVSPFLATQEAPMAARHLTDYLHSYFSMEQTIHAGA